MSRTPKSITDYAWSLRKSLGVLVFLLFLHEPAMLCQTVAVSAASFGPAVAPGGIATLFGTALSSDVAVGQPDSSGVLPTQLAGLSLRINGIACQLFYASPAQVNFLVPQQLSAGQYDMAINAPTGNSTTRITVADTAPAIFLRNGRGAILNAYRGTLEPFDVSDNLSPDQRNRLSIYLTGLNSHVDVSSEVLVEITIPGFAPIDIPAEYAGPQGIYAGLDQVNFALPASLNGVGDIYVRLLRGAIASNKVEITIRDSGGPSLLPPRVEGSC